MRVTTKHILVVALLLGLVAVFIVSVWQRDTVEEFVPEETIPTPTETIPETTIPVPTVTEDVLYTSPVIESVLAYPNTREASTVSIKIALPFERIKSQAERSTPTIFKGEGDGPDQCATILGLKKCVETRYEFQVNRGEIHIEANENNSLRLSISLTITGAGGLRGPVAEFLSLDAKEFRAKVAAYANVGLSIGGDWCPTVSVSPGFQWVERAKVEIVSGVWIDIADDVESAFRAQLRQLSSEFAKAVSCDDVRQEINRIWSYRSVPVQAARDARFINFAPRKLGYSGMRISPESVNIFLMLSFDADLATSPLQTVLLNPPLMNKVKYEPGSIRLNVPFAYRYSTLKEKLSSQLLGQEYNATVKDSNARVVVHQVELYPSNKRLVFAALMSIDLLNTDEHSTGWIYWTATPTLRDDGAGIRLHTIALTPLVDAQRGNVVAAVFDKVLLPVLTRYELTHLPMSTANSNSAIAASLMNLQNGVGVNLQKPMLQLQRVLPMQDQFLIEGIFRSIADINYRVAG